MSDSGPAVLAISPRTGTAPAYKSTVRRAVGPVHSGRVHRETILGAAGPRVVRSKQTAYPSPFVRRGVVGGSAGVSLNSSLDASAVPRTSSAYPRQASYPSPFARLGTARGLSGSRSLSASQLSASPNTSLPLVDSARKRGRDDSLDDSVAFEFQQQRPAKRRIVPTTPATAAGGVLTSDTAKRMLFHVHVSFSTRFVCLVLITVLTSRCFHLLRCNEQRS